MRNLAFTTYVYIRTTIGILIKIRHFRISYDVRYELAFYDHRVKNIDHVTKTKNKHQLKIAASNTYS